MLQTIIEQMTNAMSGYLPNLIGAFAILVLGWLVALVISALVRSWCDGQLLIRYWPV